MAQQARRVDDDRPGDEEPTDDGPGSELVRLAPVHTTVTPRDHDPGTDPDAAPRLPDPAETARALGLCVGEILTGAREVETIARWITEDVQRHLQHRAAIAARARSVSRRSAGRAVIRVGGVVVSEPRPGVAEATVVLHTRSHARAVAIRLEERRGRWRATVIGVL